MIAAAGLDGGFRGGYINVQEMEFVQKYRVKAMGDERLGSEHHRFAAEIEFDANGYPMWHGNYAGAGGVYAITKAQAS